MFLQLYIELDHIVDLILDKIRKDDIRLIAWRKGVSRPGKKFPRLIQIQLRADAQAQSCELLRMVIRIVLDLGKDFFVNDRSLVDFRVPHALFPDKI